MLWNYNEKHGQWFYPFASAIDTPLPKPAEIRHMMVSHKVDWVEIPDGDKQFDQYPDEGIEDWHRRQGLLEEM